MKKQLMVLTTKGFIRSDPVEMTVVEETDARRFLDGLGQLTSFTMVVDGDIFYLNPRHIIHVRLVDYTD